MHRLTSKESKSVTGGPSVVCLLRFRLGLLNRAVVVHTTRDFNRTTPQNHRRVFARGRAIVGRITEVINSHTTHRPSCSRGSRSAFRRPRRGRLAGPRPHVGTSLVHEGSRTPPAAASLRPLRSPSAGRNRPNSR